MRQPPPYQPETACWSFEAGQSWFPGHQLDAELANIDITLTEILQNLALIQRDDGEVANKTIGRDQLKDDLWATIQSLTSGNAQAILDAISTKQPLDATLTALAAVTTAADKLIYATGIDAFTTTTLTTFARSILDDIDAATVLATIGAQAADSDLTAVAALATTGLAARTGAGTWA